MFDGYVGTDEDVEMSEVVLSAVNGDEEDKGMNEEDHDAAGNSSTIDEVVVAGADTDDDAETGVVVIGDVAPDSSGVALDQDLGANINNTTWSVWNDAGPGLTPNEVQERTGWNSVSTTSNVT